MAGKKGRSGRKPKPTQLKLLHGTFRPDRANPNEPRPEIAPPPVPAWLTGEARRLWEEIVPELVALGILSRIDGPSLACYCSAVADLARARRVIQLHGKGQDVLQKWLAIQATAMRQVREFASEFGLTPSARTRVSGAPPTLQDPEEAELDGLLR